MHSASIPNFRDVKYILGCFGDLVGTAAKSDGGFACTFTDNIDSSVLATVDVWTS